MDLEDCRNSSSRSRSRALMKWLKEDVFLTSFLKWLKEDVFLSSSYGLLNCSSRVKNIKCCYSTQRQVQMLLSPFAFVCFLIVFNSSVKIMARILHGVVSILARLLLHRGPEHCIQQ